MSKKFIKLELEEIFKHSETPIKNGSYTKIIRGKDRYLLSSWLSNAVAVSLDGNKWVSGMIGVTSKYFHETRIAYGNNRFVAIAQTGTEYPYYSDDGLTWKEARSKVNPFHQDVLDIVFNGKVFCLVLKNGEIHTSKSGIRWTKWNKSNFKFNGYKPRAVATNGKIIVVTTAGDMIFYTDGKHEWKSINIGRIANWRSIAYANDKFVAISESGLDIMYSLDGIEWNLINPPILGAYGDITSVRYSGEMFVATSCSTIPIIGFSKDGIDWNWCDIVGSSYSIMDSASDDTNIVFAINHSRSMLYLNIKELNNKLEELKNE